jgi:DNA-binding CsgD family transcriptional regulator
LSAPGRQICGVLPPDGVDLRAELAEIETARVRQALDRTRGDITAAARLLRMTRLDLIRLESRTRTIEPSVPPPAAPAPVFPAPTTTPGTRLSGGVFVISAAAVLQLAAEGLDEKQIARRLECNVYLVEKVLRAERDRSVRRLAGDGYSTREIAAALGLTLKRVTLVLETPLEPGERPPLAP